MVWLFVGTQPTSAQQGAQFLAPPSLPPSLPGGANLPNLPPGAQREILARVLEAARKRDLKRKSRLRVQVGEAVFPILRFWDEGFALDAAMVPQLRGLVDVYDGANHIFQCLIVASSTENGELVCDFKRSTAVLDRPALDYWRDENAPVGYLPRA